jgi:hypothetical protein
MTKEGAVAYATICWVELRSICSQLSKLCRGSSRMQGSFQVRFLGGSGRATAGPTRYQMPKNERHMPAAGGPYRRSSAPDLGSCH